MALQVNYTDEATGINLPNAYFRISDVSGNQSFINFVIHIFPSQSDRDNNNEPIIIWGQRLEGHIGNGELWPQMYNHLKTLPEFVNAVDV